LCYCEFCEKWAIIMKIVVWWIEVHEWIGEVGVMLKCIWFGVVVVYLIGCGIKLVTMSFYELSCFKWLIELIDVEVSWIKLLNLDIMF